MDSQDTVSNTVTATLTWQGDGPAPPVIVEEDAAASWFIDGDGTGTCDCGLPNATHIEYNQDAYDFATRYTIYAPSASGTITLPAVTTSGSTTLADGLETDNFVNLSYSVTPIPFTVTVTLAGTTKDASGSDNILIGQGCTGTITAGPLSLSNFQWTIPGTIFNSFVVADDDSYGYVHNIFGDEYEKPNPHWHWSKDETVTVSCTAQASFNGQVVGTVTGQDQVKVWAPYYYFGNDTGGVFINPYSTGSWQLKAGQIPNTSPRGSNWQGQVATPVLFTNNGYGAWHFVQIITPGRSKTLTNGGALNCTENGNVGLDTFYPYPPGDNSDHFLALLNGWSADDGLHVTGDSPSTGLDDTIANVNIDENFNVYMMYLPPNSDSQWVPLHKFQWRWYADDSIPDGSWMNWVSGSYAGYVARSSSQRCYDHPFWQRLEGVSVGTGW